MASLPNSLYFKIIGLPSARTWILCAIFIVCFLPMHHAKICKDIDIRNHPEEFDKLQNCTIVTGSVSISLIEKHRYYNFTEKQFPQLREISGYLMLYRVHGLKTLRHMFPNLTVIRGQSYISHYTLILYEMVDLEEIGLKSLMKIQSGYVFISNCSRLCYADTIDWNTLTEQPNGWGNIIRLNPRNACPTRRTCDGCNTDNCWNSHHCQLFDRGFSMDGKIRCHPQCLGDCFDPTPQGCYVCRGLRQGRTCVEKCPEGLYSIDNRMECVSKKFCEKVHQIAHDGKCDTKCPPTLRLASDNTTCIPCPECMNKCAWRYIDTLSAIIEFNGCNIYNGDLVIQLPSGAPNTMELLQQNLAHLYIINGSLKIERSPAITSLSFFRRLHTITGSNLLPGNFSLIISENENLQNLWNLTDGGLINITDGNIMIARNSKLCLSEIHQFQNSIIERTHKDIIDTNSNGHEAQCKSKVIKVSTDEITLNTVSIIWTRFNVPDSQRVAAYILYYIETPFKNVSHVIADTCTRMGWSSKFYETDFNSTSSKYNYTLGKLKAYTQYAYFVTAQVVNKVNEQFVLNVTQGLSEIAYFQTPADIPTPPKVQTVSKSSTSLQLKWYPQVPDRELITYYNVDIFIQPDTLDLLDDRNYCEYPREEQTSISGHAKRRPPSKTVSRPCTQYELDEESNNGFNGTEAEKAASLHKRKMDCLLLNERNTYERRLMGFFDDEANGQCEPDDKPCEEEYNSFRFKRELDQMVTKTDGRSYDQMVSQLFESSLIRKRNVLDTMNHIGNQTFVYPTQNGTIENLKPFTLYTLHFFSCNNETNCSVYHMHNERTDIEPSADSVTFDVHVNEEVGNIVYLDFREPKQPNGLTVAFIVEQHDMNGAKISETCISIKEHIKRDYRYTVGNLTKGMHSFRVRSISLAQNGAYSDHKYIQISDIQEFGLNKTITITIISLLILFCSITCYVVKVLRKRRRVNISGSDQNILLQEMVGATIIQLDNEDNTFDIANESSL